MAANPYDHLTFLDAPRIAPQLLARGDPMGAVYSFIDPDQLTPDEREEWFPKGDSVFSKVLKTVGNPLVIAGVALSMAYPVAAASDLFRWESVVNGMAKSVNAYSKPLIPLFNKIQSAISIFGGTKFGSYLRSVLDDFHSYKATANIELGRAAQRYETETGKGMDFRTQIAAFHKLDGLDQADSPVWGLVRDRYARVLTSQGIDGKAAEAYASRVGRVVNPSTLNAPDYLVDAARTSTLNAWDLMFSANTEAKDRLTDKTLNNLMAKIKTKSPEVQATIIQREAYKQQLDQLDTLGLQLGVGSRKGKDLSAWADALKTAVQEKNFEKIADYAPHIEAKGSRQIESDLIESLRKQAGMDTDEQWASTQRGVSPMSHRLDERKDVMIPDWKDFSEVADAYSPETLEALKILGEGTGLRKYSQRLLPVMSQYAHSMGKTYAWTAQGWGKKLLEEFEVLKKEDTQGIKAHLAANVYLPAAMGKLDPTETVQALAWSDLKWKANQFFKSDKVRDAIGEKTADFFTRQLGKPSIQNLSFKTAGAKLAGFFYQSALGLNPASAGLNLMQNLITTSGVVEPKYLMAGLKQSLSDVGKVAEEFSKGDVSLAQAFDRAVPHYAQQAGEASEIESSAAFRRAMVGAGPISSKIESVKSAMMSMFTGTEKFNRLWAFNAGKVKALREAGEAGMSAEMKEAFSNTVGRQVMEHTQFPGGVLGTASGLVGLWPPLRQFSQFPLRMVELATMTSRQIGRAAMEELPGWQGKVAQTFGNLGGPGRLLATTGLAYGAGKLAGLDLSRGLLFGALPTPENPDSPFYPMPFVPPILQIPGAIASDLFSGEDDFKQTRSVLPLMVPGGVQLSRMIPAFGGYVAPQMTAQLSQTIGRSYADYNQRMPDGRVAIYSADGVLKGFQTPVGIFAKAIGWNSITGDPEGDLTQYLVKQRDRIRNIRRSYVEAMAQNNTSKMETIQDDYKRLYPQLGPIVVKEQDIQAVHARHDVGRVERILNTMPPEARSLFGPMVSVALGDTAQNFLGVDPALLGNGSSIKGRDQARVVPQSAYTNNVKTQIANQPQQRRDTANTGLRDDHVGRQPNEAFPAFAPFNGF